MPETGFELTITTSERVKTVHGLDRSATVTAILNISPGNKIQTFVTMVH
jgi:hypothetical protein